MFMVDAELSQGDRNLEAQVLSTDGFTVSVIPSEYSKPEDIAADWQLVSYQGQTLKV